METHKTIGILGGGQLGRMLLQEAFNLNLKINVLDNEENAPCRNSCNSFSFGDIMDFNAVHEFGKRCDIVTIEIEHVNVDALAQLEKEGTLVYPQPDILRVIQDKGLQKDFYKLSKIPTSPFHMVTDKAHALNFADQGSFVMKLRKGGYDGKGVVVLNNKGDFESKAFDAPSILEEKIAIEKEISVIVARNNSGEIVSYPPVEMEFNQEVNLVNYLLSPASLTVKQTQLADQIAKNVINELNMVVILSVEMFLTKNGDILVNEIAPRPHNSGHQSIEGNFTSQYEQHLRALLDLPLGSTKITFPSVMINLLGERGHVGIVKYVGIKEAMALEGVYIHLYGKRETKPFRKMGHVTIIDETLELAKAKAEKIKNLIKVIS